MTDLGLAARTLGAREGVPCRRSPATGSLAAQGHRAPAPRANRSGRHETPPPLEPDRRARDPVVPAGAGVRVAGFGSRPRLPLRGGGEGENPSPRGAGGRPGERPTGEGGGGATRFWRGHKEKLRAPTAASPEALGVPLDLYRPPASSTSIPGVGETTTTTSLARSARTSTSGPRVCMSRPHPRYRSTTPSSTRSTSASSIRVASSIPSNPSPSASVGASVPPSTTGAM